MRLLFERGFAPTHAFSAFYRWMREDFGANAVLHFGTHGALEFMPGKQAGLSGSSWSDRLIGDVPNLYLYAANNPSEGTIAKRRSAATLISYLTPPVAQAGLYRGLIDIKSSLDRYRGLPPEASDERERLAVLLQAQAATLDLVAAEPVWTGESEARIADLGRALAELEQTLIPHGLHVAGSPPSPSERVDMLLAVAEVFARRDAPTRVDGSSGPRRLPRPRAELEWARSKRSEPRCVSRAAQDQHAARRRPRDFGDPCCARWAIRPARAWRRSAPHAGNPANGPQPARLRSIPHPERIRRSRRQPARLLRYSPATCWKPMPFPSRSRSCFGAPTT